MSRTLTAPRRLNAAQTIALALAPVALAAEVRASQTIAFLTYARAMAGGPSERYSSANCRYERAQELLSELYLDSAPMHYQPTRGAS